MSYASLLFRSLLCFQPWPVQRAFASIRIDCEVADLEGHQILEEMTSDDPITGSYRGRFPRRSATWWGSPARYPLPLILDGFGMFFQTSRLFS
jgi:hypothetical protein